MISAPSIVKMHNQSYTLTVPVSAGVGDWDASIAFTGAFGEIGQNAFIANSTVSNNDLVSTYDHATGLPAVVPFNSFVIKAGAAGAAMNYGVTAANATAVAFGACETSPSSDRCRLIAVGFEVTNTTAEIYRQGSVSVAALPSPVSDYGTVTMADTNAAGWLRTEYQSWFAPKFASTRSALLAVPGAATWAAKDGCYAIPRLANNATPCDSPAMNKRAVVVQDSSSDVIYALTQPGAGLAVPAGGDIYPIFNGLAQSGFGALQVYFTGLSNPTSLTITMRTVVEYFPTFNSPLLPLSTPSPSFCPKAFEIYSATCQLAPYAVPVKQNSAGEYFRRVLRIASSVGDAIAPYAGSFAPIVSSLSMGAGAVVKHLEKRAADKAVAKGKATAYVPKSQRIARDEAGARAAPTRR